jgi:hypothetical protein
MIEWEHSFFMNSFFFSLVFFSFLFSFLKKKIYLAMVGQFGQEQEEDNIVN